MGFYAGDKRKPQQLRDRFDTLSGRLKFSVDLVDCQDKRILVVGDSYGWFAKWAFKKGAASVYSLDIAPPGELIAEMRSRMGERFDHHQESILELGKISDPFDMAVFFEVIEHLPPGSEPTALQNIHKNLKNNGILYMSTPSKHIVSRVFDPAYLLGHRHYSQSDIRQLLEEGGFATESMFVVGGLVDACLTLWMYVSKWILGRTDADIRALDKWREREFMPGRRWGLNLFAIARKVG
jgi:SAM-dependent methyltransferase